MESESQKRHSEKSEEQRDEHISRLKHHTVRRPFQLSLVIEEHAESDDDRCDCQIDDAPLQTDRIICYRFDRRRQVVDVLKMRFVVTEQIHQIVQFQNQIDRRYDDIESDSRDKMMHRRSGDHAPKDHDS